MLKLRTECIECTHSVFIFCVCVFRVMGKNHPVNGGHRAPALTAPWGAMGGTPRLVPLRTTADQVLAKPHNPYITVAL